MDPNLEGVASIRYRNLNFRIEFLKQKRFPRTGKWEEEWISTRKNIKREGKDSVS